MAKKNPADAVERRKVSDLIPYARNSRTHSDAQVAQLAASIREWGWTTPVLIDQAGMIIAGHGRVLAARKLGLEDVPVVVADGWTDAQKRAYVNADNKLALNAGWDSDLLRIELGELQTLDIDMDLIGFNADELALALGLIEDSIEDEEKEPTDRERFTLLIQCENERQIETLFLEMQERGFDPKIMS
jgi:ParB-like chromosome segregation protein Spo0J